MTNDQKPPNAVITCRGHPNISATHAKTIELVSERDVTSAGTCIVGVAAEYDEDALLALRGSVRVRFRSGGVEDVVMARINPSFRRGDPLIFRRHFRAQPNSFGIAASKGASGLDRALIKRLQREGAELEVAIWRLAEAKEADGVLYVVGMPIGNPNDVSTRALDVLASVDLVLAEDTRTARSDLEAYGVRPRLMSYHDHNERTRSAEVVALLKQGRRVALVSEAGMPLLSDPGYHVVRAAVDEGLLVTVVPGPDAVVAALAVSGFPVVDFRFIGFLPRNGEARRKRLAAAGASESVWVFFEAGRRIVESLEDVAEALGSRSIALCCNLTKPNEHVLRGSAGEVLAQLTKEIVSGEFVVVIDAAPPTDARAAAAGEVDLTRLATALVELGLPTKTIASALSRGVGVSRNQAFSIALEIKKARDGKADLEDDE